MSKTIQVQIDKSQALVEGLQKNLDELQPKGIYAEELQTLREKLRLLEQADAECDALRAELSQKVKRAAQLLADVKASSAEKKKIIKSSYLQEEWQRFGIADKR